MRAKFGMALASAAFLAASPAYAGPATLHGFCSLSNTCSDNGTNTPTGVNPPVFGFANSGGSATSKVLIDILVPTNRTGPASFTLSGNLLGLGVTKTASLFSSTPWTSGQLDAYLGISASPTNPIGNYTGALDAGDPTASGFYVYQANLGTVTLPGTGSIGAGTSQDNYTLNLSPGLASGSYILAFMQNGRSYEATANSGAILETRPPLPEPATWAMMLLGFGGIGAAMRRRRNSGLAQIA